MAAKLQVFRKQHMVNGLSAPPSRCKRSQGIAADKAGEQ